MAQRTQRKWEVFPGKNQFHCGGRVVMAGQAGIFYVTVLLIVGTSAAFFAVDSVYLAQHVSPAVPAVGAILFIFTVSNLFRTSFSDPGERWLPRACWPPRSAIANLLMGKGCNPPHIVATVATASRNRRSTSAFRDNEPQLRKLGRRVCTS